VSSSCAVDGATLDEEDWEETVETAIEADDLRTLRLSPSDVARALIEELTLVAVEERLGFDSIK
jgi:hypothetical protein